MLKGFLLSKGFKGELNSKYDGVLSPRNPFPLEAARKERVSGGSTPESVAPPISFLQSNELVETLKSDRSAQNYSGCLFIDFFWGGQPAAQNFRFLFILIRSNSLSAVDSGQPCSC